MITNPIAWQVELRVKPGALEALRQLTREMVEFTQNEPGALIYERHSSADGQTVYVYERYVDSAAAVEHLNAFGKLFGARFEQLVERRQFLVFGTPTVELQAMLDRLGARYFARFDGFDRWGEQVARQYGHSEKITMPA